MSYNPNLRYSMADVRRWAFYNIGAFMCSPDTGQVHGPSPRPLREPLREPVDQERADDLDRILGEAEQRARDQRERDGGGLYGKTAEDAYPDAVYPRPFRSWSYNHYHFNAAAPFFYWAEYDSEGNCVWVRRKRRNP